MAKMTPDEAARIVIEAHNTCSKFTITFQEWHDLSYILALAYQEEKQSNGKEE